MATTATTNLISWLNSPTAKPFFLRLKVLNGMPTLTPSSTKRPNVGLKQSTTGSLPPKTCTTLACGTSTFVTTPPLCTRNCSTLTHAKFLHLVKYPGLNYNFGVV